MRASSETAVTQSGKTWRLFVAARVGRPGAEQQQRGAVLAPGRGRWRNRDRRRLSCARVSKIAIVPSAESAIGLSPPKPHAGPAVGAARDQRERPVRPALIDVEGLSRCPRVRPRCWSRRGRCRRRPRRRRRAGGRRSFHAGRCPTGLRIGGDERERAADPLVDVVSALVLVDQPARSVEKKRWLPSAETPSKESPWQRWGGRGSCGTGPENDRIGDPAGAFVEVPAGSRVPRQQRPARSS